MWTFRGARDAGGFSVQHELQALAFENLLQRGGDVGIFMRENLSAAVDDGNAAAETREHLAKLEADIAATENDEMLGDGFEFHDGNVGEVARRIEARDAGNGGAGANVDEDFLRGQRFAGDFEGVRAGELGVAAVEAQRFALGGVTL